MYQLALPLSRLDLVRIGLAGTWETGPFWLDEAVIECVSVAPLDLLKAVQKASQYGLLEAKLINIGFYPSTKQMEFWLTLRTLNAVTRTCQLAFRCVIDDIQVLAKTLGIPATLLKGSYTSYCLYQKSWMRASRDIDILVPSREDAILLYYCIEKIGFLQGYYTPNERKIVNTFITLESDSSNEYELPRLSKIFKFQCLDNDELLLLKSYQGSKIFIIDDFVYIPVSIEIHYRLDVNTNLLYDTEVCNIPGFNNFLTLTPTALLLYLCFKLYVDIHILRICSGIKLLADALRLLKLEGSRIEWENLILHCESSGLAAPLRYFLNHAHNLYGCEEVSKEIVDKLKCIPTRRIDFELGDFLPSVLTLNFSTLTFPS